MTSVAASAPTSSAPDPTRAHPGLTLAAVCFGLFMVGLDSTVVSIANPAIAADLHASFAQLQWVTNSYLLGLAVFLVLGGKLGDRLGRKRFYLGGLLAFGLTSVAIGLVGSIGGVIVLRAAQGLSAAILMPQTLALLRSTWPRERFGMAVGIWGGVSSVAIAIGPLVAGVLVAGVGWESVFYLNAPIALIGLVFGARVLRESVADRAGGFDFVGVVLLALGLFALVFAVVQSGTWGWGSAKTLGTIAAGLVVLAGFAVAEARAADPLLPLGLFRSTGVSVGGLVFVTNFFAVLGITFLITLYLMNTRGDGTIEAGLKMLPMSAVSIVSAPLGAILTARIGARRTASLGLLLMAAALAALVSTDATSPYLWMAIPFVLLSLGSGLAIPAGAEAIIGGAPVHLAGVASGFQTTCIQIGGALGTSVLAAIVAGRVSGAHLSAGLAGAATQGIVPEGVPAGVAHAARDAFVGGIHSAMLVSAGLALVVSMLAFALLRDHRHVDAALAYEEAIEAEAGHV